ncbi:MAG: division/cell wall cluster transcriptional repressor MraZ [Dehalococcoidia bacterium]
MWQRVGYSGGIPLSSTMFLGEYEYRIDQKGRVAVPPRFRGEFSGGIIVTRGYERCVVAYTPGEWSKLSESYTALPTTSSSSRQVNRLIFSSAFNLNLDRLGRLILPPSLKEYAQIQEKVVIAGVGNYLEIWGKESWERERAAMEEKAAEIAEGLRSEVGQG